MKVYTDKCETCMHKNVCKLKEAYSKIIQDTKAKYFTEGEDHNHFSTTVKCDQHFEEQLIKRGL